MKHKVFLMVVVICFLLIVGCKEPLEYVYITNNIDVVWQGSLPFAPSNPETGWAYYDTTQKKSFVWDGYSWQVIASDGTSIVWKGELTSAPYYPEVNWAYYNVIDGNSYIYNGNTWDYLAKAGRDGASGIMLWLGTLDSAPANPVTGYSYHNSATNCSYIWDGDSWEILAKDGTDGLAGRSIVWKGVLSSAPNNPEINWAYYNSVSQASYIFNGKEWDYLAQSVGGDTIVHVPINWRGSYSSAPMFPSVGDAYYNSTSKASYVFDGSVWQQMSKDGADGKDGTYTYEGTGYLITWKGSLEEAPSSPTKGWAYYNEAEGKSFIWDGFSWQIMAQDGGVGGYSGYSYLYVLCYTNEGNYSYQSTNQMDFEVDFGTIGLNSSSRTTLFYIALQSSEKESFKLTGNPAIQVSGPDADCFSVIQPSKTEVDSGTYITDAAIVFTPTSLGEKTATISIPNNSNGTSDFSFTVKGIGAYWPKTYDGGEGDGNDAVMCSAEDSEGNLYFVGYGFELVNDHSGYDWWIKKYDKTGAEDTINWDKKTSYYDDYNYESYDCPRYIAIDSSDNVCIASKYNVVKYSPDGELIWEKAYPSGTIIGVNCNNSSDIFVRTSSGLEKILNTGVVDYSISAGSGAVNTFDNAGNVVMYYGSEYSVYNNDGSLKFTKTISSSEMVENTDSSKMFSGYIAPKGIETWVFPVVSGHKYLITIKESLDTEASAYYISPSMVSTTIFEAKDSVSSYSYTANSSGTVRIVVVAYSSGNSGNYSLSITDNGVYLTEITKKISHSISTMGFDNENNYYVGATCRNYVDSYSKDDVMIKKYSPTGGEDTVNWNKVYDWGHCENEKINSIVFDGNKVICIGSGHDLISGSTSDDTWVKVFEKDGTLNSAFELDFASGILLAISDDTIYLSSGSSIIESDKTGSTQIAYGNSKVSRPVFLVSSIDGSVYSAGIGSNLVTTTSGYDWQIVKLK